jgi:beta-carotene ketolase (CrtW type)
VIQPEQPSLQQNKLTPTVKGEGIVNGVFIACAIIGIWASSLVFLLTIDISNIPTLWLLPAVLVQTFLYTGLFITAHDAMHGVVCPENKKLNHFIGAFALVIYGLLPYQNILKKHWIHHNHPASELDPDFHDSKHKNFFAWYFHFMKQYWSWLRIGALVAIFNIIVYTLDIPERNLTWFWVVPSILSSVQLFYFGTYLPHREPKGGYNNSYRAKTNALPVFWSFVTCYHFGYHKEHHAFPAAPWWKLPEVYKLHSDSI